METMPSDLLSWGFIASRLLIFSEDFQCRGILGHRTGKKNFDKNKEMYTLEQLGIVTIL